MKFEEALIELRKGKTIKLRSIWDKFSLENIHELRISKSDLFSENWEVYEEPGKTFDQVLKALSEGKDVRRKEWGYHDKLNKGGLQRQVSPSDLLSNDWEICE